MIVEAHGQQRRYYSDAPLFDLFDAVEGWPRDSAAEWPRGMHVEAAKEWCSSGSDTKALAAAIRFAEEPVLFGPAGHPDIVDDACVFLNLSSYGHA